MICEKIQCDSECCIPEGGFDMTGFLRWWAAVVIVLAILSSAAFGYYLGGKSKAAEFHKVCENTEMFIFKDYDGDYACFRVDEAFK